MKTIDLKGKKYAQVSERIREVHKENKNISIETDILWIGEKGGFQVKATIKTDKWVFTWHSFWMYKWDKSLEKQETVAVGRALAFAWYLADWEIASFEEIEEFYN